jgi:uncharacterized protein YcnI
MRGHRTRKVLGGVIAAVAVVGLSAGPASAHVTLKTADKPAKGGFATVAFQVPNEMSDASTTKLHVQFPSDHPLLYVSVMPKAGWTYSLKKEKLAKPESPFGEEITEYVSEITWEGGAIKPGEFEQFPVSIGPLPEDADTVAFPAIQTYDNGKDVNWIEKTGADGKEPEHPAPSITLTAKAAEEGSSATATTTTPGGAAVTPAGGSGSGSTSTSGTASDDSSKGLAIAGLVLGVLALALAGFAAYTATQSKASSRT